MAAQIEAATQKMVEASKALVEAVRTQSQARALCEERLDSTLRTHEHIVEQSEMISEFRTKISAQASWGADVLVCLCMFNDGNEVSNYRSIIQSNYCVSFFCAFVDTHRFNIISLDARNNSKFRSMDLLQCCYGLLSSSCVGDFILAAA